MHFPFSMMQYGFSNYYDKMEYLAVSFNVDIITYVER